MLKCPAAPPPDDIRWSSYRPPADGPRSQWLVWTALKPTLKLPAQRRKLRTHALLDRVCVGVRLIAQEGGGSARKLAEVAVRDLVPDGAAVLAAQPYSLRLRTSATKGYGKRALISADSLTARRSCHSWTNGRAGVRAFCMRQGHMHLCLPEWRGSRRTGLWTRRETRALRPATARSHFAPCACKGIAVNDGRDIVSPSVLVVEVGDPRGVRGISKRARWAGENEGQHCIGKALKSRVDLLPDLGEAPAELRHDLHCRTSAPL